MSAGRSMRYIFVCTTVVAIGTITPFTGARATDYLNAPNPACRVMRGSSARLPSTPEPNHGDTWAALPLTSANSYTATLPAVRKRFAQAFPLMLKIDREGTDALSGLAADTPHLDHMIDQHIINLVWARSMLGLFYEEGRAPPVDYTQAERFYESALNTRFDDDRGCVHDAPVAFDVMRSLIGFYAYGVGVTKDPAKARALAVTAGSPARPILFLMEHDALPKDYRTFRYANLNDLVGAVRNPPQHSMAGAAMDAMGSVWNPQPSAEESFAGVMRVISWVGGVILLAAVGGVAWLLRKEKARGENVTLYRACLAVYDTLHGLFARAGLVVTGLISLATGLWTLSFAYSLGLFGMLARGSLGIGDVGPLLFFFGGVGAFLTGVAKLAEAARFSLQPKNTQVHGAARPAAEPETKAAARGDVRAPDLHNRTFTD